MLFRREGEPDWESEAGLTMADALMQCLISYGPLGFAQVRIARGVERIPTKDERKAAREAIATLGSEPTFLREEECGYLTIAKFRELQDERHARYSAWHEKIRELRPIAYPFEYVVGIGDDATSYYARQEHEGKTWEEALEKAGILGASKRLPFFAR